MHEKAVVGHVVARTRKAKRTGLICLTVPGTPEDFPLIQHCQKLPVSVFLGFGHKQLTLFQFFNVFRALDSRFVVRLTADNPLIDPEVIDQAIEKAETGNYDIVASRNDQFPRMVSDLEYPPGYDVEVIDREKFLLMFARHHIEIWPSDVEHVTPILYKYGHVGWVDAPVSGVTDPPVNVTVDYIHDLCQVEQIMKDCGPDAGYREVVQWHIRHQPFVLPAG